MLKATPEDRVVMWRDAVDSDSDVLSVRLHVLAKEVQETVAESLNLYSHDELFEETFDLLGATGFVGRDALRIALEEAEAPEGPARLLEVLAELLDEGVDDQHLASKQRDRSAQLAEQWRELLAAAPTPEVVAGHWTVAEVAEHFGVTPQAVYRWIDKDRIQWRRRPGGSYLIPADQFDGVEPMSLTAASVRRGPTPETNLSSRLRGARPEVPEPAEAVDAADPASAFARAGTRPRRRAIRRSAQ